MKMIFRILLLINLISRISAGTCALNVTQTSYQAEENHNITLEINCRYDSRQLTQQIVVAQFYSSCVYSEKHDDLDSSADWSDFPHLWDGCWK
ncbi:hypothetical protein Q5P01_002782 [Channa striata]|uniref:Uncharacterized protein n=1 Tax=Channa striata TaxID=64152 RepID=A0AA88NS82_CHASR|nr:hypothetical protein Q5P01_002782 [Channa striata]